MKLLVDMSSLLWQSLLAGESKEFSKKVEFEGKLISINGWEHGYDCALSHTVSVMNELEITPADTILVVEGAMSKSRRKAIYSGYKDTRDKRPPEAYVEFTKCQQALVSAFRNSGAQVCGQDGVEGDDVLGYLAKNLDGEIVILTRDGDMTTLISDRISLYQNGKRTRENKYGPFSCRFVPVYKALCGDGDEYKGAKGFGAKMFLDFLVWAGEPGLAALEGMMIRRTLHELEPDVAEFKPMRKIIDGAEHVYQSYECALLHDEWVNTKRNPLKMESGAVGDGTVEPRLAAFAGLVGEPVSWWEKMNPTKPVIPVGAKNHAVFDCELIGTEFPVFLVCARVLETCEKASFWWHVPGDMDRMAQMLQRPDLTWVSFNGLHFDAPIMSAAVDGKNPLVLKQMAHALINEGAHSWHLPSQYGYTPLEFDHIDLIEVAPGVRVSLKAYAGRMGYPTMVDLPFHHDQDLSREECVVLESYCQNDLGVTEALFQRMRSEIDLRIEMSLEHGIDLRSKSDAQVAEAVLKKVADIKGRAADKPSFVTYAAPAFIETDSDQLNELIERLNRTQFTINAGNGQVESPEFLNDPIQLGFGTYQFGVGGLHSTHDKCLHVVSDEEYEISDFDVAGYYPKIMLIAGLTPRIEGGGGPRFISAYENIYDRRIEAKRSGNKKVANALKISLNGTFGKLGSPYSVFYSPDLMLAVTMTGQLNLATLIYALESNPSIRVLSANTDGIAVHYPVKLRDRVLRTIVRNAVRTGFEYEETRYSKIAMKDVNNYLAITSDKPPVIITPDGQIVEGKGKIDVKRKGLYAAKGLMKNPTMQVCSNMAIDYLKDGVPPSVAVHNHNDIEDFVAIRAVKGGGIQFESFVEVDDWVCVQDVGTKDNLWMRQKWLDAGRSPDDQGGGGAVKRKSRPAPVQVGIGGQNFGRIARWYMKAGSTLPINYVGSGNKVPKTEGAQLCMTLPPELPSDIDRAWYVAETISMLGDMGVEVGVDGSAAAEPEVVNEAVTA